MGESEVTDFDAILFLFFFFLLFYTAYKLEKERPNYFRKVSGEKFKKRAIMSAIVYAFYILYAQYLHYTKGLAGLAEGYWNLLLFSLLLTPLLFLEPKEEFVVKLNKRSRILAIVYGTV
ncbi:MAG: hypothetical protein J7L39_03755, partial [Candidatus Aenigmarchaeota archaeon]|nr:hypothetical protein [Candidatus Aenigmarchaeota archaeon]